MGCAFASVFPGSRDGTSGRHPDSTMRLWGWLAAVLVLVLIIGIGADAVNGWVTLFSSLRP